MVTRVLEWADRAAVTARSTTSETAGMNSSVRTPLFARVLSKIKPESDPHPKLGTPCWLWTSCQTTAGYGRYAIIRNRRRTMLMAHRLCYELLMGEIPPGLHLDHLCRVPLCVNPAHLEPVLPKENYLRGYGVGALNARKTHCMRGHSSWRRTTIGNRMCSVCRSDIERKYRDRAKAKARGEQS